MLKKTISQKLTKIIEEQQVSATSNKITISFFIEEINYINAHHLIPAELTTNITFVENDSTLRFENSYIERGDKETEQTISTEEANFLNQPLQYLKTQKNEFIYLESEWLDIIRVDAISLEADDVFGTFDVMLGLKLPKKLEKAIKTYLDHQLSGPDPKFDLMFSKEDGLWNLNFALNYLNGYKENLTIRDAYQIIYTFLFKLVETVEENE